MKLALLISSMVLMMFSNAVLAQVRKCTDNNGKVMYVQGVCPLSASNGKTIKTAVPKEGATPSRGDSLAEKSAAFDKRQAERNRNDAAVEKHRDSLRAAERFMSAPLAPGERRTVRIQ